MKLLLSLFLIFALVAVTLALPNPDAEPQRFFGGYGGGFGGYGGYGRGFGGYGGYRGGFGREGGFGFGK